ncbi:minor tail protein [Arthrobacter phage BaileyBlu]|uniref:Minor tail protein n=1 Tax=Arthrobacter phage BaileyBlu TaxID=2910754 RepID=A0AA49BRI0_9CAUD|nr:tail fiber protein [Arthrobacter phage BaileyBlu]UJQ87156.1 minor tail protein [Arthrobacter phage BaileyBlu]
MNNLDLLIPARHEPTDVFRFGLIVAMNPPRVRLDGDLSPVDVTPIITCPIGDGDRVLVQIHNRQLIIVGRVSKYSPVVELGNTENLNDLTEARVYHQAQNVEASTARNYPVALAGLLEVFNTSHAAGGPVYIYQRYTTYNSSSAWVRTNYAGTWNAWRRLVTEEDGVVTMPRIRLTDTGDASSTSTGHAFQIGPDNGQNLIIDGNEIMARNNGVGGQVYFEFGLTSGTAPIDNGSLTRKDYVDRRTYSGSDSITPSAANTPTSKNITFPAGRFSSPPTVMVTPSTTVPGSTVTGWAATDITATGAKLWVTRTNTTNTTLNWIALSND